MQVKVTGSGLGCVIALGLKVFRLNARLWKRLVPPSMGRFASRRVVGAFMTMWSAFSAPPPRPAPRDASGRQWTPSSEGGAALGDPRRPRRRRPLPSHSSPAASSGCLPTTPHGGARCLCRPAPHRRPALQRQYRMGGAGGARRSDACMRACLCAYRSDSMLVCRRTFGSARVCARIHPYARACACSHPWPK